MNTLQTTQVALGNVFTGFNYRGEEIARRLVGGAYGTVTKYFLVDCDGNLKSRVRETIEEVLDGFEIESVQAFTNCDSYGGEVSLEIDDIEVGDLAIVEVDGSAYVRQLVGGVAYDKETYFMIDFNTGERKSRTRETIEEVLNGYDKVVAIIKPLI